MAAGDKNAVQGGNPTEPVAAYEDSAADRVQAVMPTNEVGAPITGTNPMHVQGADRVAATGTLTATSQAVTTALSPDDGSVRVYFSGTFTGTSSVRGETSDDGGTTWKDVIMSPLVSVNPTLTQPADMTAALYGFGVFVWGTDVSGCTNFRARCTAFQAGNSIEVRITTSRQNPYIRPLQNFPVVGSVGTGAAPTAPPVYVAGNDGTNIRALSLSTKGAAPAGTPYYAGIQQPHNGGRTPVHFWATGVASGTTTTETAITLTKSAAQGGATSSASSFVVTSGKRWRIVHIIFAARGHATATAQVTTFAFRVNTAGAVTTSSNIWLSCRAATAAVSLDWDRVDMEIDDGIELVGDGTMQFGITANAVFTTNAPTWDVQLLGYEY